MKSKDSRPRVVPLVARLESTVVQAAWSAETCRPKDFGAGRLIKDENLAGLTPADFDGDGDLDIAAGRHQFISGRPAIFIYESKLLSP